MKKIRLTESEFHSLIKRMVVEAQKEMQHDAEMEEGLGDMVRGVKRFATGYGSKEEREERMNKFFEELDKIEDEFNESPENFFFTDWETKKESLIKQAEENNFLGDIEQIGQKDRFVRYKPGRKGFEKMATGYTRAQGETIFERKKRR
jgi:predicted house-cleaning noncanonical NTP pyrophosphatase (MazG superfamily)